MKTDYTKNEQDIDYLLDLIDDCSTLEGNLMESHLSMCNLWKQHFSKCTNLQIDEFYKSLPEFEKCVVQTLNLIETLVATYWKKIEKLRRE